jgi:phosphopantothenoylcysteine decarboxylase/phosphopantothenate--cysteine ligase
MEVLSGRRVIVTAGPTIEAIDPVRFISNRSSGRMGYAIAAAARGAGAEVTLISGPTALAAPDGIVRFRIQSAEELRDTVLAILPEADAVVMAASVADYRPIELVEHKMRKRDMGKELTLRLVETPDVLRSIVLARRPGTVVIGFKAELGEAATSEAARMLKEKGLDIVVANDVSDLPDEARSNTERVAIVTAQGVEVLPHLPTTEIARRLVARLAEHLTG